LTEQNLEARAEAEAEAKINITVFSKPRFFTAVVGYLGITAGNQFHPRSNLSTDNSVPEELARDSQAKPRDSRGYHGNMSPLRAALYITVRYQPL